MEEIKNNLKAKGLSDSSIKTYDCIITDFLDFVNKEIITTQDINDYLNYLMISRNYSGRSRNLAMKVIRYYCRELRGFTPVLEKAKENKPIPRVCEDDEFTQILSVTKNIKHKLCLLLMRYSGLRRWEVIRVMKHHIQDDGRLLVKSGKGDKDRYTMIPPQISDELKAYVLLLPAENAYLFPGQNGYGHYNKRTPQAILNNAFEKLGWKKERWLGCHSLRHAFTLWCVDSLRLDFDEVSKMLGHSVMRTSQIYTQCRRINLRRAIEVCRDVSIIH